MIYTTLEKIRENKLCESGWKKLLADLGKTEADNEPLSLKMVLEINGVHDAIWALRCIEGMDGLIRELACRFAESVLPNYEEKYPGDMRPRNAIEVARRYAHGEATPEEIRAARAAACAAARDAARAAARDAARAAACAAARAAAWAAARDAAWAAACAAAWSAAWSAARDAAWAADSVLEQIFIQWLEENSSMEEK